MPHISGSLDNITLLDALDETLADVMLMRGIPEHIRSDNGPEFIAEELRKWLGKLGTRTLYIEPGSPWENVVRRLIDEDFARFAVSTAKRWLSERVCAREFARSGKSEFRLVILM
jgi:hypothetical protein